MGALQKLYIDYLSGIEGGQTSTYGLVTYLGLVQEGLAGPIADEVRQLQERVEQSEREDQVMNSSGVVAGLMSLKKRYEF